MRYFLLGFALLIALVVSVAGLRGSISRKPPIEVFPDMDRQPKIRPQTPSSFFADGRASRLPVEGTVSRGARYEMSALNTGFEPGTTNFVALNPVALNEQVMARGRERYQITCAVCHGAVGDGNGITKKFGMAVVANLHDKRIVTMPDGELFHVITHGRNLMGPYGPNVEVEDRWAIIHYLRALHLSRLGTEQDLSAEQRAMLK
ncbi:MAG: cytochrome c [Verrucomicrobiota bacterium]|nr:cytochrome c [Verrucomicrobiota bacterium]